MTKKGQEIPVKGHITPIFPKFRAFGMFYPLKRHVVLKILTENLRYSWIPIIRTPKGKEKLFELSNVRFIKSWPETHQSFLLSRRVDTKMVSKTTKLSAESPWSKEVSLLVSSTSRYLRSLNGSSESLIALICDVAEIVAFLKQFTIVSSMK